MTGMLYGDLKQHEDAVNWLLVSDAMFPGTVIVYEALLKSYLALDKTGRHGAHAIHSGFNYALTTLKTENLIDATHG